MSSNGDGGAPCGACRYLRRKCMKECIFAPYMGPEPGGVARFAALHKVFGASNVSKLLHLIPDSNRCDAVLTITYEAHARLANPVLGCVAQILNLQEQVASLQAELTAVHAQLATRRQNVAQSLNFEFKSEDDQASLPHGNSSPHQQLQFLDFDPHQQQNPNPDNDHRHVNNKLPSLEYHPLLYQNQLKKTSNVPIDHLLPCIHHTFN